MVAKESEHQTQVFCMKTWRRFVRIPLAHIPHKELVRLNISIRPPFALDPDGFESHDGDFGLRPLPMPELERQLQATRPWEFFTGARASSLELVDEGLDNHGNATEPAGFFIDYLGYNASGGHGIRQNLGWGARDVAVFEQASSESPYCHPSLRWSVHQVYDRSDPADPHQACLLAENAELYDQVLTTGELWVLMALTFQKAARAEYRHHDKFPLTIVTISGRKIRITQGCLDAGSQRIIFRMSEVVDVSDGEGDPKTFQRLKQLMCFVLSRSVSKG